MTAGMLWFDNSDSTLATKIQKAADYYHKKYGRLPDLVLVHPNMLKDQKLDVDGITVRPYRPVLPGHIWIGIEEMPTEPKESRPA
jgi:hypothetical protein